MTVRPSTEQWTAIRRQLAVRRIIHGLTQTELGLLAGTSKGAVANIEGGQRIPIVDSLIRLADPLGLAVILTPKDTP